MKKNGLLYHTSKMSSFNRKGFLIRAGLVSGGIFLNACVRNLGKSANKYSHIKGELKGPDEKAGHLLRDKISFQEPISSRFVKTIIIGSGISGLSAARWLKKEGHHDFELLELEDHAGGNSHTRSNTTSSYPLGAHYITIANNEDQLLIDFLQEVNVITHFEKGLPFYNEFYLCFDPEERLLINGQWQEGLIPQFGLKKEDKEQISKFFSLISELKKAKGKDGKYAFDIPLDKSSTDPLYRKLDQLSFKAYLLQQGFNSKYLLWYLNYCCKDDYGQKTDDVSAWAGLSYFAGHKGKAANAEEGAVLTWPEGNGWLVNQLRATLKDHIRTSSMVHSVRQLSDGKIAIDFIDLLKKKTCRIIAEDIIVASPQFVNKRILKAIGRPIFDIECISYSPWMVANITVNNFPSAEGAKGLCWDNVPYDKPSVGYVYAGHQATDVSSPLKVITYYLPLCDQESRISRLAAYSRNYDQWLDLIIPELEFMHPGITAVIENIEVWVWGHGMVIPRVNYLWGGDRQRAALPVDHQIFFAHTDLSGISLFEEGFHQGIRAAKELLVHHRK